MEGSLTIFKKFLNRDFISAIEIIETLCEHFRAYLLKNYNGETPAEYFLMFKRVLKAATKDGYFRQNLSEDIAAKASPVKKIKKEILSEKEYIDLMNTPCTNYGVKKAFVFSLYTGLRWADIKILIKAGENVLKRAINKSLIKLYLGFV